MNSKEDKHKKRFSLLGRIQSANHAWRGIAIFFKNGHSAWALSFFAILAFYLGFALQISSMEWAVLVLTVGQVMVAEAFNTAIEIDIDLTSPEYHPFARDTKDVAAAAVLLCTIVAGVVGLIIFLPKII